FSRNILIVCPVVGFGRRSDDGLRKFIVFFHSVRKRNSTKYSFSKSIFSGSVSGEVSSYNHFYLKGFAQMSYCHIWVGSSDEPIRNNILGKLHKLSCNLIQNLTFIRNSFR